MGLVDEHGVEETKDRSVLTSVFPLKSLCNIVTTQNTTLNAGSVQQFSIKQINEQMYNPLLSANLQIFVGNQRFGLDTCKGK